MRFKFYFVFFRENLHCNGIQKKYIDAIFMGFGFDFGFLAKTKWKSQSHKILSIPFLWDSGLILSFWRKLNGIPTKLWSMLTNPARVLLVRFRSGFLGGGWLLVGFRQRAERPRRGAAEAPCGGLCTVVSPTLSKLTTAHSDVCRTFLT